MKVTLSKCFKKAGHGGTLKLQGGECRGRQQRSEFEAKLVNILSSRTPKAMYVERPCATHPPKKKLPKHISQL